ncbi:ANTAR domain-containing protein [Rhodococcus sp. UNC23MFCrub1.1]|uniref:ANTAR domain-containing protein n=1 Tax=Rhodococcus sp. UNC23MFCrub1.1 TaxID=1449068 RepID=UPI00056A786C|nr:ANTAR domain-containing protein [Rhodococcus sp. UNC23MFCrub1.1]
MSDHATPDRTQIDIGVGILVGLCGYTPEQAFTELTAFSHRHKVGLISTSRALTLLAQSATPNGTEHTAVEEARSRWRHILHRGADRPVLERTA